MSGSRWHVHQADPPAACRLAAELGVDPVTAQLLINRGFRHPPQASRFLSPTLHTLEDPSRVSGISRAAARLGEAIARRERIMIFGDSDVDGLTAGVILYDVLRELGAEVEAKQSNRLADGYGLPGALAREIPSSGAALLVLVDCGTNQADDLRLLQEAGVEVIVIDHHLPASGAAAEPSVLVNPHLTGGGGKELCSAGLAFKVAQALLGDAGRSHRVARLLDLAALGTLADCAPLIGDSRVMVAEGLPRITQSHRIGLARLCEDTQTSTPSAEQVLKRLTPRLNASGRLGDPAAVWHLLLSAEPDRIEEWLLQAGRAHATTKQLYRRMIAEAQEHVSRLHFRDEQVLVLSSRSWHPGLMGPLASQLVQRYGRPAIAVAVGAGQGIGSGRSVPRINLLALLQACGDLLVRFGGHAQACGLTIEPRHLASFREGINRQARGALEASGWVKTRTVDLELPLGEVTSRWVGEAGRFAPFGQGNPRPTVMVRGVRIARRSASTAVLSDGSAERTLRGRFDGIEPEERQDVVVRPSLMNGELTLRLDDARGGAEPSSPGLI